MKVYEYLMAADDADLLPVLMKEYKVDEEKARRLLEEKLPIVQAVQVKDDITGIRVERDSGVSGAPHDVYGVLKNGEDVAIALTPWGYLNHIEVVPDPGLSDLEIAAHLLWELTFVGNEEDKIDAKHKIEDAMNGPTEEYKPGIIISQQVKEFLESNPEFKEYLDGMSFEDFKNSGRKQYKD